MSEPTISATPDVSARRQRGSQRRGTGRSRGGAGMSVVLVVALAGFAAAGWFIAHQQQQLDETERLLATAGQRLQSLEERLRMTDAAMTESGADTNEQINLWESEIRKLWDISNKRNRGWIEGNRKVIGEHASSLSRAQSALNTLKSKVDSHETALGRQDEVLDRLASIDGQVRQLVRQQRDLVDKVNAARQVAASLKASLEPKVNDHAEALRANDAHRTQLNRQLRALSDRLGGLERQLAPPPAVSAL